MNGEWCDDVVIVGYDCNPGSPDFDSENGVCDNDHEWNEAYCSYSVGWNEEDSRGACAYCAASAGIVYMVFY